MAACPACRRFDAAFRAGVAALRSLPAVGVSRGFGPRLRSRLRREFTVRLPVVAHWSGALGTLLLVATVGVLGWDLLHSRAERHSPVAVGEPAAAPQRVPVAPWFERTVVTGPRYDAVVVPIAAFHPLQSILIGTSPQPSAAGGEQPHYDLSVVWGGP